MVWNIYSVRSIHKCLFNSFKLTYLLFLVLDGCRGQETCRGQYVLSGIFLLLHSWGQVFDLFIVFFSSSFDSPDVAPPISLHSHNESFLFYYVGQECMEWDGKGRKLEVQLNNLINLCRLQLTCIMKPEMDWILNRQCLQKSNCLIDI